MIEIVIEGIKSNWEMVLASFVMLVAGTIITYHKFGIKRVLLGKHNDHRELVYYDEQGKILLKPTLNTWKIILTGGMNTLSLFLIIMMLFLSYSYYHDLKAIRENDEEYCQTFGTVFPTEEQIERYRKGDDFMDLDSLNNISFKGEDNDRERGYP